MGSHQGASRGIGYLAALFMAKRGGNSILHSRSAEHTAKVESEVMAIGVEACCLSADLAESGEVNAMLGEIEVKGTQVDLS